MGLFDKTTVAVQTKSPLSSSTNWAALVATIAGVLPFFGIHPGPDFVGTTVEALDALGALSTFYIMVRHTFFQTSVTTTSVPAIDAKNAKAGL